MNCGNNASERMITTRMANVFFFMGGSFFQWRMQIFNLCSSTVQIRVKTECKLQAICTVEKYNKNVFLFATT